MPDFPQFVPGKTPLRADTLNDLFREVERQSKFSVAPPLDYTQTSGGVHIYQRSRERNSPTGFYARIHIAWFASQVPEGLDQPATLPQAYWIEQQSVKDDQLGIPVLADTPNGRKGLLEPVHALGSAIQNIGPRPRQLEWIALVPQVRGGTFTLSYRQYPAHSGIPAYATGPIPADATADQVQAALEALPNVGAGHVAVFNSPNIAPGWTPGSGRPGGPWLVEFSRIPWYGLTSFHDPNSGGILSADGGGLTTDPDYDPTRNRILLGAATTLYASEAIFNILPYGQIVWVDPIGDGDTKQYLFTLGYVGLYGRIIDRAPVEGVSIPAIIPNPPAGPPQMPMPGLGAHLAGVRRFSFIESVPDAGGWADRLDGIRADSAVELNQDIWSPLDWVVWLVPLFVPGVGMYFVFESPVDWRLISFGGTAATFGHGVILNPRAGEGTCSMYTPATYFGLSGDDYPFIRGQAYIGVRVGLEPDGTPIFVAPSLIGPAFRPPLP